MNTPDSTSDQVPNDSLIRLVRIFLDSNLYHIDRVFTDRGGSSTPDHTSGRSPQIIVPMADILATADKMSRRHYTPTLFPQAETQFGTYTVNFTVYIASIAAGLVVQRLTCWLPDISCDPNLAFNLLSTEIQIEDYGTSDGRSASVITAGRQRVANAPVCPSSCPC